MPLRISTYRVNIKMVRALEAILDEVMTVFSANSVSISLLNASSDTLLIEVQRGLPETSKVELPVGVGITGWWRSGRTASMYRCFTRREIFSTG